MNCEFGEVSAMQFDVYQNSSPKMRDRYSYVVDVQIDLLSGLATRMVMPLAVSALSNAEVPRRLCPSIVVKGQMYLLIPFEAAPLDKRFLKRRIASMRKCVNDIISAADAVMGGV
jgi:toxin CcdB